MQRLLMIGLLVVSSFVEWTLASPCIGEEKFPTRPITFLVGFAPGGTADLPIRYLAEFASKILGQPVTVVNREGGGGAVALGELKNAKPDGYTVGFMSAGGIMSAHMRKVPYHPVEDFSPIIQYCTPVFGFVVQANSPFKTLKDLIVYAKANPNKVTYSTTGAGSPQHLVMIQLGEEAKVEWTHVPFGGGVPAVTALLGGHVTCSTQSTVFKPYVDSGRLRLLASLMEKRLGGYPNVPTLIELGYNIVAPSFYCIVGPKDIPKDKVKVLHDCFHKGMETQGFKEVLIKLDMDFQYRDPQNLKRSIKELYESTGKIIESLRRESK